MHLSDAKLLILDVDGVLTNGTRLYTFEGKPLASKSYIDKDFTAIRRFREAGIQPVILSGDESNATVAKRYNIPFYHEKYIKMKLLHGILADFKATRDTTIAVGDDYHDIPLLQAVRWPCCPKDAIRELYSFCHISNRDGGTGVIADLFDWYLRITDYKTDRVKYAEIYKQEVAQR